MKLIKYGIILLVISTNIYSEDFIIHIVGEKETLWSISKKYDIPFDEIIKVNNLTDTSKLSAGSQLKIPDKTAKQTVIIGDKTAQYVTYVFKKGDSLWQISRKYGININELMELNNIKDVKNIKSGSELRIEKISKRDPVKDEKN